jgi:hypothetical protein
VKIWQVRTGSKYFTKSVTIQGRLGDPRRTRGLVRVDSMEGTTCCVTWLMRDGTIRKETGLPAQLPTSKLLVEVEE